MAKDQNLDSRNDHQRPARGAVPGISGHYRVRSAMTRPRWKIGNATYHLSYQRAQWEDAGPSLRERAVVMIAAAGGSWIAFLGCMSVIHAVF